MTHTPAQDLAPPLCRERTVDILLELRRLGVPLTAELQRLLPIGQLVVWAIELRGTPTWRDVATRWGVSRATAYRWLPTLLRARREARATCQDDAHGAGPA